jgi:hypothetical protein
VIRAQIFGLVSNGNDIGFNVESTGDTVSREDTIAPIVDILSTFRVQVSSNCHIYSVIQSCLYTRMLTCSLND